jgi:hypothetical protein
MNILIAKTILQSWINENDISLDINNAKKNFDFLRVVSASNRNEEITECLDLIRDLKMIHILENKSV